MMPASDCVVHCKEIDLKLRAIMADHVSEWLGALLDGELQGLKLRQVKDHLTTCAVCQAELNELRSLSRLLKSSTLADRPEPLEDFTAALIPHLPTRPAVNPPTKRQELAWLLIPIGVAVVWPFLHTLSIFDGLIRTAGSVQLLDGLSGWFVNAPAHSFWFLALTSFYGSHLAGDGLPLLTIVDSLRVLRIGLETQLAWQLGGGLLYWGMLAALWFRFHPAKITAPSQD
jgi:anti-sigma factor RsiW